MQPAQAPIYRKTEELLELTFELVERIPKSLPNRISGEKVMDALYDALDFLYLALKKEQKGAHELQCMEAFALKMSKVKTIYRVFLRRKVVSKKQYARALKLFHDIASQAGFIMKSIQCVNAAEGSTNVHND